MIPPVPPVPPVPIVMPPVNRLDQRIDRGCGFDGVSARRERQAGRRSGEAEAGGDEGRDDKCTHVTLPSCEGRRRPSVSPVVWRWRPRAAVRESAGGPHVHPSIGLSPGSPRTATPSAIGCKPTPRNQNGEWLTHSLLVHWIDTH